LRCEETGAYLMLFPEFLGKRSTHNCSSTTTRCIKVSLHQQCHRKSTLRDFRREEETSADCFAMASLSMEMVGEFGCDCNFLQRV
jgi:hypothetical protein